MAFQSTKRRPPWRAGQVEHAVGRTSGVGREHEVDQRNTVILDRLLDADLDRSQPPIYNVRSEFACCTRPHVRRRALPRRVPRWPPRAAPWPLGRAHHRGAPRTARGRRRSGRPRRLLPLPGRRARASRADGRRTMPVHRHLRRPIRRGAHRRRVTGAADQALSRSPAVASRSQARTSSASRSGGKTG